ncbi:hypothetical protein [Bradyrhizobium sp. Tv2a-2]|uniref:hypothetical protein n=1 Tax=Bradyrhizobium sp. Tv2a-2 TaxID=113395 RepID=UPI000404736A|nr:hypothetical protein [Bradyrhizobium sp. Tv2a-2]
MKRHTDARYSLRNVAAKNETQVRQTLWAYQADAIRNAVTASINYDGIWMIERTDGSAVGFWVNGERFADRRSARTYINFQNRENERAILRAITLGLIPVAA